MGLVGRLSANISILLLIGFGALLAAAVVFFDRYMLETSQRLSRDIAAHIVTDLPLYRDGSVNKAQLKELAHDAMVINPNIEVFVLGAEGQVLGHALPPETVVRQRVDLEPVRAFLGDAHGYPLLGDDPRSGDRTIFSVAPLGEANDPQGYVYVLLRGQLFGSMAERLRGSYVWPLALGSLVALGLIVAALAAWLTRAGTRPLARLTGEVARVRLARPADLEALSSPPPETLHEVRTLREAFARMARRLVAQYTELERSDQLRRELISNVSHDLRTPLTSLQGYLETLLVNDALTAQDREDYLRRALRGSERLGDLIGSLFELAKLDTGVDATRMEPCVVAEVAQDVVQDLQLSAERNGIELTLNVEAPGHVHADVGLLQRVFENLIGNALRHTPAGGTVRVHVAEVDGAVSVSVRDNGVGIHGDDRVHIFDRYRTGTSEAIQKGAPATGLGLAIVKRILELHDSRIRLTDATPGSEFAFELRLASG